MLAYTGERVAHPFEGSFSSADRRSARRLATALSLCVAFAAGLVDAGEPDFRTQWKRGLAEYKKKNYDAACALLQSAARAQPKDAALWGDLGLCEYKRGGVSLAASLHASRMAVHLGDEKVRKAAYYNLGLAGDSVTLPQNGCAELSAVEEAQCSKSVFVCTKAWSTSGIVVQTSGEVAFFGLTRARAVAGADAVDELDPSLNSVGAGLELSQSSYDSCDSWCGLHAWETRDDSPVHKQIDACATKRRGPYPVVPDLCVSQGKRCTEYPECAAAVLSHAGDSPPLARDIARLQDTCVTGCRSGVSERPKPTCRVVYADACKGRLGVVCALPKTGGSGVTLTASEITLSEPE